MNGFHFPFELAEAQHLGAVLKGEIPQKKKDEFIQDQIERQGRALAVSNLMRPLVRTARPVLYHGTRYPNQVLRENRLLRVNLGTSSVHFTRDLQVATYWALLSRINGDEGVGAVLIFD